MNNEDLTKKLKKKTKQQLIELLTEIHNAGDNKIIEAEKTDLKSPMKQS
jgi:hypothetical protein